MHLIKDLQESILVKRNLRLRIFINQETPMRSTIMNLAFFIFHVVINVLINIETVPTNTRLDEVMIPITLVCLLKSPIEVMWATLVSNKNSRKLLKEERRRRQLEIRQRATERIRIQRQRRILLKVQKEVIIESKLSACEQYYNQVPLGTLRYLLIATNQIKKAYYLVVF